MSAGRGAMAPGPLHGDSDDSEAAETAARRMLASSEKSCRELRRRLEQRGFSSAAATAAVDRLAAHGWVDDRRLAETLVRRGLERGHSRTRVIADLRARGAGDAGIHRALDLLAGTQAEAARTAARRLLRGRPAGTDGNAGTDAPRIAAALQRRGFAPSDIRAALGEPGALGPASAAGA